MGEGSVAEVGVAMGPGGDGAVVSERNSGFARRVGVTAPERIAGEEVRGVSKVVLMGVTLRAGLSGLAEVVAVSERPSGGRVMLLLLSSPIG